MPAVDYWRVETGAPDGLHGGLMYRAIAGSNDGPRRHYFLKEDMR